ncbi:hypothetical protein GCM10023170_085020 [Phytohabitans houttuyneae]|uniref:Uncharacterized protein n=1 Tax=Phytohabitans houttuyneae TaxID=1076126 RepID=A0A6V8KMU1_9ACTN|nr:hypothetical protein Phou_077290 [Phytohabitans houttuyneae]
MSVGGRWRWSQGGYLTGCLVGLVIISVGCAGETRDSSDRGQAPPSPFLARNAFDFANGDVAARVANVARVNADVTGTIAHEVRTFGRANRATSGDSLDSCRAGPDRSACLRAAHSAGAARDRGEGRCRRPQP